MNRSGVLRGAIAQKGVRTDVHGQTDKEICMSRFAPKTLKP